MARDPARTRWLIISLTRLVTAMAAVLGVIKAMGAIDQSPALLGGFIGAALVGTFAGIFFSYGVIGPISLKIKAVREKQLRVYIVVKQTLLAFINGAAPQVALEYGRKVISAAERPSPACLSSRSRESSPPYSPEAVAMPSTGEPSSGCRNCLLSGRLEPPTSPRKDECRREAGRPAPPQPRRTRVRHSPTGIRPTSRNPWDRWAASTQFSCRSSSPDSTA